VACGFAWVGDGGAPPRAGPPTPGRATKCGLSRVGAGRTGRNTRHLPCRTRPVRAGARDRCKSAPPHTHTRPPAAGRHGRRRGRSGTGAVDPTYPHHYMHVHTCTYQNVLVCTSIYQYIPLPVHTSTYHYILVCTSIYQYIPVHTSIYWYVLVCAGIYWYLLLIFTLLFRC
jgi:hypothetical protein